MAQNEMKSFAITPLSLLFLLLTFPRSPPSFQETALSAVASQVQHLGKQKHETAVLTSTLANENMNSDNVLEADSSTCKQNHETAVLPMF